MMVFVAGDTISRGVGKIVNCLEFGCSIVNENVGSDMEEIRVQHARVRYLKPSI